MAPFAFILGLYAVTSGLGLTLLVSSVAKMIEARDRTRRYWVHTCWLAFLFVVNVTSWLSLWAVRGHQTWSIFEDLLLLLIPILDTTLASISDFAAGRPLANEIKV